MQASELSAEGRRVRNALAIAVQDLSPYTEMGQAIRANLDQQIHAVSGQIGYKPGMLHICFESLRHGIPSAALGAFYGALPHQGADHLANMVRDHLQRAYDAMSAYNDEQAAQDARATGLALHDFSRKILPLADNTATDGQITLTGRLGILNYVLTLP